MFLDAVGSLRAEASGVKDTTVKVTLELHYADDALSGVAAGPDASRHQFSGWIGLVGVIDQLLADGAGAAVAANSTNHEETDNADH